ncbi:ATP-binding cassette domain-containing protein [Actinoplanes sp. ATCC 53533]|uniref:ATP-binding cassette domain-containing protein n=1 Tax=Actinoplanes sp. ATCC 53533 TaxID=1288362 RepID=UPI0026C93C63|nr:ATP-binding cassette domain-containing protein [Actinoplanes sp. ATCC 53533]
MEVLAEGIVKSFGEVEVLRGVDLRIAKGTVFALLGPNGAGKTTMVRILSTLLAPDAGRASVAGHDVVREPAKVRAAISLTGQYAAVDELLTGEENLLMMGRLVRLDRARSRRRAAGLLAQFDLVGAEKRRVRTYSGGMRRRLDLAMGLVATPSVIFLDEPTTGLDPRSRQTTWEMVRRLVADGVTVVLTTQYLEEADQLADRIALIDHGAVIAEGTPEELKWRLAGERVELLLADDEQFTRAVRLLGAGVESDDRARYSVSVATDGSADQVRELLDRVAREGIQVRRISLHRPTLDDVFLALTSPSAKALSSSARKGA